MLLKLGYGTKITIAGTEYIVRETSMRTVDSSGLCDELYVVARAFDGDVTSEIKIEFSGFGLSERDLNGLKSLLTSG